MKFHLLCAAAAPLVANADALELNNGTILQGTFMGGTAGTVRFETADGLQVIPRTEALALTFTPPPQPAAGVAAAAPAIPAAPAATPATPAAAPAAPAAPVSANAPVTLPAGTLLTVKLDDAVDSRTVAGRKFGAKLVADLTVNGMVAARAGTGVIGEAAQARQGGRLAGKSALVITLTGMNVGGRLVPIQTSTYGEEGPGALKKTARNAALGAIIGEATRNDAGGGAAIGLGTAALGRGGSINFPAGTLLEFELTAPLDVPAGKS
ncbi:MAG: hypothetical protein U1F77_07745 [Kiritimatiellia bacterium]